MDLIGDTYALSESDFTDVKMFEPGSKQPLTVEAIVNMMKRVKLPNLPGSKDSTGWQSVQPSAGLLLPPVPK